MAELTIKTKECDAGWKTYIVSATRHVQVVTLKWASSHGVPLTYIFDRGEYAETLVHPVGDNLANIHHDMVARAIQTTGIGILDELLAYG